MLELTAHITHFEFPSLGVIYLLGVVSGVALAWTWQRSLLGSRGN